MRPSGTRLTFPSSRETCHPTHSSQVCCAFVSADIPVYLKNGAYSAAGKAPRMKWGPARGLIDLKKILKNLRVKNHKAYSFDI